MATERSSDTVIKVYTANRPPEESVGCAEHAGRSTRQSHVGRIMHSLQGAQRRARSAHVPSRKAAVRRRIMRPAKRQKRAPASYVKRMSRDALVVCALLMCVMAVKALPFDWARQATEVMSGAVNMSVDLDKTLGQLQFVRDVIPESAMVFWSGASSRYSAPFEGVITHGFSEQQPWLEYSGNNQAVRSVRAGKVIQIEQGTAGDWAVRIEHEDGMETVYAFLTEADVQVGDSVNAAQDIGRASGTSGARIYFEMRIDGRPVDPSPYLGIK